jgi:hypothetical protein
MRRTTAALFVLAAVFAAATPLASQTRPRRVSQPLEDSGYSESQPRDAVLRPRTAGELPRAPRRSLGRTLFRVGMAAAVLGVAGRGGSCAPGRGSILLGGIGAASRIPRDDRRR